jgi:hypothetical protein
MSTKRQTKTATDVSADQQPRVIAAPGLLDQPFTVVREEDDTDASYESRCELFALLIEAAGHR